MLLKNRSDIRVLLWIAAAIGLLALEWTYSHLVFYFFWLNCYFGICSGVFAHNHNHNPVFHSKALNRLYGYVLTFFYGYPTFVWIPTHNLNHHKHVNRPGDATITWRWSDKHSLWVACCYFFASAYYQKGPIDEFIAKAKASGGNLYRRIQLEYAVWLGVWAAAWMLGVALHGWRRGTVLWLLAVGLPALVSLWTIMFFNYEQHVHTDAWSDTNHSRNFTGPVLNFLLFNNGFHGAHHESPTLHWSKLATAHAEFASHVHPALNQRNLPIYFFRQFVLAPFWPGFGTQQIGQHPQTPVGEAPEANGPVVGTVALVLKQSTLVNGPG